MEMEKRMDRRGFVAASAAGIAAVAALATGPVAWAAEEKDVEAPEFPFTWVKMDRDTLEAEAHDRFKELGGCSHTVFSAIVGALGKEYGYPYNQIPTQIMFNGHGGYNRGSLCGTLGGAAAVISLFVPTEDNDAMLGELQSWYADNELPTYPTEGDLPTTVAESVNCADSLSTWMAAAEVTEMSDPKRIERCSALAASVAGKTCELLDAYWGLTDAEVGTAAEKKA